ncbi:hypothetical protein [Acinetobacter sp. ESBL14]|uniref:hypothetical protein n=1 Tax=Acinetobacter sp. ESBL14 TaxID=3077329 RepID=UPI002FC6CE7E
MKLNNFIPVVLLMTSGFSSAEQPISLEQYRKSIEFKLSTFDDYQKKMDQFEKEKRNLTRQEIYDHSCYIRDFYESTSSYINKFPEYKIQSNNYEFKNGSNFSQLESAYSKYQDLITTNNIKCSDGFVPPPYAYNLAKWKELPKVTGASNLTLNYIDSEDISIISWKPLIKSVKTREIFKKYPDDIYIENDYIFYCETKEFSTTRFKIYRHVKGEPLINNETKYPSPYKKESVTGTITPVFDFTCK